MATKRIPEACHVTGRIPKFSGCVPWLWMLWLLLLRLLLLNCFKVDDDFDDDDAERRDFVDV